MTDAARSWDAPRRAAYLATVRLFTRLPLDTVERVGARFQPKHVRRGDYVFLEGEPADSMNLLASGRIKVTRASEDGQEVILRLIGPGELFGGAGGWGGQRYPANAVAQEDAVVLQLPAEDFHSLIALHPDFALAVIGELGARLREAEARIRELQTERVDRRIARVVLRLARRAAGDAGEIRGIVVPLSRQDLAELSGTTLSTASRTLSGWARQGLLAAGRERVTILQPEALAAIAEP